MTVIYADGASGLRLSGGLGPLQFTGATGVLGDRLAAPVDMVLGEQVSRLRMYVETGKPQ